MFGSVGSGLSNWVKNQTKGTGWSIGGPWWGSSGGGGGGGKSAEQQALDNWKAWKEKHAFEGGDTGYDPKQWYYAAPKGKPGEMGYTPGEQVGFRSGMLPSAYEGFFNNYGRGNFVTHAGLAGPDAYDSAKGGLNFSLNPYMGAIRLNWGNVGGEGAKATLQDYMNYDIANRWAGSGIYGKGAELDDRTTWASEGTTTGVTEILPGWAHPTYYDSFNYNRPGGEKESGIDTYNYYFGEGGKATGVADSIWDVENVQGSTEHSGYYGNQQMGFNKSKVNWAGEISDKVYQDLLFASTGQFDKIIGYHRDDEGFASGIDKSKTWETWGETWGPDFITPEMKQVMSDRASMQDAGYDLFNPVGSWVGDEEGWGKGNWASHWEDPDMAVNLDMRDMTGGNQGYLANSQVRGSVPLSALKMMMPGVDWSYVNPNVRNSNTMAEGMDDDMYLGDREDMLGRLMRIHNVDQRLAQYQDWGEMDDTTAYGHYYFGDNPGWFNEIIAEDINLPDTWRNPDWWKEGFKSGKTGRAGYGDDFSAWVGNLSSPENAVLQNVRKSGDYNPEDPWYRNIPDPIYGSKYYAVPYEQAIAEGNPDLVPKYGTENFPVYDPSHYIWGGVDDRGFAGDFGKDVVLPEVMAGNMSYEDYGDMSALDRFGDSGSQYWRSARDALFNMKSLGDLDEDKLYERMAFIAGIHNPEENVGLLDEGGNQHAYDKFKSWGRKIWQDEQWRKAAERTENYKKKVGGTFSDTPQEEIGPTPGTWEAERPSAWNSKTGEYEIQPTETARWNPIFNVWESQEPGQYYSGTDWQEDNPGASNITRRMNQFRHINPEYDTPEERKNFLKNNPLWEETDTGFKRDYGFLDMRNVTDEEPIRKLLEDIGQDNIDVGNMTASERSRKLIDTALESWFGPRSEHPQGYTYDEEKAVKDYLGHTLRIHPDGRREDIFDEDVINEQWKKLGWDGTRMPTEADYEKLNKMGQDPNYQYRNSRHGWNRHTGEFVPQTQEDIDAGRHVWQSNEGRYVEPGYKTDEGITSKYKTIDQVYADPEADEEDMFDFLFTNGSDLDPSNLDMEKLEKWLDENPAFVSQLMSTDYIEYFDPDTWEQPEYVDPTKQGFLPENTGERWSQPEETVPEETVPEETVPEETVPEETVPEETVPEETVPEETTPEETTEQTTEETVPEETTEETSLPPEEEEISEPISTWMGPSSRPEWAKEYKAYNYKDPETGEMVQTKSSVLEAWGVGDKGALSTEQTGVGQELTDEINNAAQQLGVSGRALLNYLESDNVKAFNFGIQNQQGDRINIGEWGRDLVSRMDDDKGFETTETTTEETTETTSEETTEIPPEETTETTTEETEETLETSSEESETEEEVVTTNTGPPDLGELQELMTETKDDGETEPGLATMDEIAEKHPNFAPAVDELRSTARGLGIDPWELLFDIVDFSQDTNEEGEIVSVWNRPKDKLGGAHWGDDIAQWGDRWTTKWLDQLNEITRNMPLPEFKEREEGVDPLKIPVDPTGPPEETTEEETETETETGETETETENTGLLEEVLNNGNLTTDNTNQQITTPVETIDEDGNIVYTDPNSHQGYEYLYNENGQMVTDDDGNPVFDYTKPILGENVPNTTNTNNNVSTNTGTSTKDMSTKLENLSDPTKPPKIEIDSGMGGVTANSAKQRQGLLEELQRLQQQIKKYEPVWDLSEEREGYRGTNTVLDTLKNTAGLAAVDADKFYANMTENALNNEFLGRNRGLYSGLYEMNRKNQKKAAIENMQREMTQSGASPEQMAMARAEIDKNDTSREDMIKAEMASREATRQQMQDASAFKDRQIGLIEQYINTMSGMEEQKGKNLASISASNKMQMEGLGQLIAGQFGLTEAQLADLVARETSNLQEEISKKTNAVTLQAAQYSKPSGGGGGNSLCCWIMLEARYGDGTMDMVVRKYRDEMMTERNRRGYYKFAEVIVPLMRRFKPVHKLVQWTFGDPLVKYGGWYYGDNKWGWIFAPIKSFWLGLFNIIGKDTEFVRENGEVV